MSTKLGFIGYSALAFNEEKATSIINEILDEFLKGFSEFELEIVSGLTDIGVPKLVYEAASERDLVTVGFACKKAENYSCFPVNKKFIIGENWGDESESFLDYTDYLFKIGGGRQSEKQFNLAKQKSMLCLDYKI